MSSLLFFSNSIDNNGFIDQQFELNKSRGFRDYLRKRKIKRDIIEQYIFLREKKNLEIVLSESTIPQEDLNALQLAIEIVELLIKEQRLTTGNTEIPFPPRYRLSMDIGEYITFKISKHNKTIWEFEYAPYKNDRVESQYIYLLTNGFLLSEYRYFDRIKFSTTNLKTSRKLENIMQLIGTEKIISDENLPSTIKELYIKRHKKYMETVNFENLTIHEGTSETSS